MRTIKGNYGRRKISLADDFNGILVNIKIEGVEEALIEKWTESDDFNDILVNIKIEGVEEALIEKWTESKVFSSIIDELVEMVGQHVDAFGDDLDMSDIIG